MGKVKESIQNVYDECQALYEKGGVQAVCDYVIAQQIANNPMYEEVKYGYCTPCEAGQPCLNNICLVCGSSLTEIKPVVSAPDVSIGKPIYRVAELRYLIEGLDDNDLICIETCDEHGDVQDLYPMYIDVIENVRLTDGSIVREVRFCQMPNAEPDTRDKQPLVDMVIEELKSDIADGDCTVLDELLMKLPWEILKHSLNEDKWKLVDKLHLTKESIWGEIRNDFEDDGIVYVNAWLTADDNEEGKVIAKVNTQTKEIKYLDVRAKTDSYAQEMIQELL